MLEGALDGIVFELGTEVQELVKAAAPALEALTARVCLLATVCLLSKRGA
jgi:hypothetical protein